MKRVGLLLILLFAIDAHAQSQFDGTWSGTTAQGRAISFEISAGAIRKLVLSARVEAVGCSSNVSETINTVVSVGSNGTFNYQTPSGTPTSWTVSGALSAATSQGSGSLSARINFVPVPGVCVGSANTTWTATNGSGPGPGPGPGPTGSWAPQTSGATSSLGGIHFSSGVGIASGGSATILRTTNGGASWSRITPSGLASDRCCYNARFASPNVVWVVGIRAVLRSTNGGESFGGSQFTDSPFRTSIFPVADDVAWAVGGDSGMRYHYRYTMSGSSISSRFWSVPSQDFMRDIFFVDPNTGWSVGSPGRIIKITNASTDTPTFTTQLSGTSVMLHGIFMLNETTGWTVGDAGTILKTTNGGASWISQFSATTNDLQKVFFRDANNGIIAGEAGTILTTTDGGNTWSPETSGTSVDLRHVFVDSTSAYVVGASGTILKKGGVVKRKRGARR